MYINLLFWNATAYVNTPIAPKSYCAFHVSSAPFVPLFGGKTAIFGSNSTTIFYQKKINWQ